MPKYIGTSKVEKKVGVCSYDLNLAKNIGVHDVFHVNFLKPYWRGAPFHPIDEDRQAASVKLVLIRIFPACLQTYLVLWAAHYAMLVSTQAGFTFLLLARWFLTTTHASLALLSIPDGTVISDEERMQRWMLAVTFTLMAGCVFQQEDGSISGREWWVLPRSVAATRSARCDQPILVEDTLVAFQ